MNKQQANLFRMAAASAVALLAACGGGGGGGGGASPSPAPAPTPAPPAPPPAVSLKNRVMLFVVPTGVSSSSYLPGYDVTLTSYKQYLYRLVPELDRREMLDSISASSYSVWHINAISSDDRFFVRHDWRQFEIGGSHEMKEYGPDAPFQQPVQPPTREWRINRPASDGCSAAVGDWYYYRSARNFDILSGSVGGDFYRYNIATGQEQLLQPFGSAHNCQGNLMASAGVLYDVRAEIDGSQFVLYRRDLDTGMATQIASFNEPNPASYDTTYRFAIEEGVFYIVRRRKADALVEIYRWDTNVARPTLEQLYADIPGAMDILIGFDVDDGHVMVASQSGYILMLDTAQSTQQVIDLGVKIGSIAQVFVR